MAVNKVIYNGKTLIDLTDLDVAPNLLYKGTTAVSSDGERIIGTMDAIFLWGNLADGGYVWRDLHISNYLGSGKLGEMRLEAKE